MKSSILLLTVIGIIGSSGLQCPSQQHLTDQGSGGRRSNPPLVASVEVTSHNLAYHPEEIFAIEYPLSTASNTYTWCSGINVDHSPNVTINMVEPVLLYGLVSGGYSITEHVTAFSLEYSETAEGDVVPYQLQGNTLIFNVPEPTDTIPLVFLPRPIVATTLYFHVLDYVGTTSRGACWTLGLIGCPVSEAIEEEFPSVETVSPTTPSATPSATSSTKISPVPSEIPSAQPEEGIGGEGGSDSQAVAIAVSTSLLTVLAVAVIVAVGVILCWRISSKNRVIKFEPAAEEQRERVYTIRTVENELYTDPNTSDKPGQMYEELKSPSSSSSLSQTQETMDDVLYATPNTNTTANHLQVYEPVQPSAGGGGGGSMVDNPQYLATAGVDLADMTESPLVQNDEGYEMMSPAAAGRGGKWEEHHSHTYANTETVRAGEDDTPQ